MTLWEIVSSQHQEAINKSHQVFLYQPLQPKRHLFWFGKKALFVGEGLTFKKSKSHWGSWKIQPFYNVFGLVESDGFPEVVRPTPKKNRRVQEHAPPPIVDVFAPQVPGEIRFRWTMRNSVVIESGVIKCRLYWENQAKHMYGNFEWFAHNCLGWCHKEPPVESFFFAAKCLSWNFRSGLLQFRLHFCSFTDKASEERTFFSVRLKNCLWI